MSEHKINRTKFDQSQAIEQFERYKETGNGSIIQKKENHAGYSSAYSEGWERIFGNKEEEESDNNDSTSGTEE